MQKTNIEWEDYTSNPIKGYCPNNCTYCYAHRLYNRYHWDKTIRLELKPEVKDWQKLKEPSRIFVGSTFEMFYPGICEDWIRCIIGASTLYPQHTFITLTKFPENLKQYNFPENWWVGMTVDGKQKMENTETFFLLLDTPRNKRFVSFEPTLDVSLTQMPIRYLDWIIIGGLTPKPVHKKEWIDDIVSRADKLNIPVFIKNNANYPLVRKEYPV